jgi:hypothetical protein
MGTTYIANGAEPVTDLTLAVLEDMGYDTIYGDPEMAATSAEEEEKVYDDALLF